VGNGPGIPELLTVKDQPKENNQFYRTDVALSHTGTVLIFLKITINYLVSAYSTGIDKSRQHLFG